MFVRTNGKADSNFKKRRCIIGIDQSYAKAGISIAVDGKLKKVTSIDMKYITTKRGKRLELRKVLKKVLYKCMLKFDANEIAVIHERVRTFTAGAELRPDVIKAHTQLAVYICDTAAEFDVETYSVDTRAWKNAILGSSKPTIEVFPGVKNPQKIAAVKKVIELGFEESIVKYKHNQSTKTYDDDAADSACIALYGFVNNPKLKKEL